MLKGRRSSEWFDFNIFQLWQVRRAYALCEKHSKYGTVKPSQLPKSISIALILASLLALSVAGNYFISDKLQPLDGSGLTEKDEK